MNNTCMFIVEPIFFLFLLLKALTILIKNLFPWLFLDKLRYHRK